MSYGRDFAFWFTLAVLSLMLISATLAYFLGLVMGRRLEQDREDAGWRDGFEAGVDLDRKAKRMQDRAQRLQR